MLPLMLMFSGCMMDSEFYIQENSTNVTNVTNIYNGTNLNVSGNLTGSTVGYICVYPNGTIFRKDGACI